MLRIIAMASILAGFATTAMAAPEIGKLAPDFTATDINGNAQSLGNYRGKTVVLEWTNPECPFVVKHYSTGNMQQLQQEAITNDVVWLKINSSAKGKQGNLTPEAAKASLAKDKSAPTAYILDAEGQIGQLYEAKTTPHMYIIDKEGLLVYMGAIDDKPTFEPKDVNDAKNYVRDALKVLSEGKTLETPSTRAYGCAVKYEL